MAGKDTSRRSRPLAAVPSDEAPVERRNATEAARAKEYGERLLQYTASGVTLAQAARMLELPETTARRYFDTFVGASDLFTDEQKREQVRLDLETLRMLIQAHMPRAMKGSIGSGQLVISAMRERANRLALDEAIKVQISSTAIGDAVEDIVAIIEHAAPIELPPLPELPAMPGQEDTG